MNIKKFLIGAITGALIFGVVILPSLADSNSIDFESYTLGNINGQDGWTALGSAGSGCAIYDEGVSSSLSTTGFGAQSFRISNAVTSGCFGDQAFSKPLSDAVGESSATAGSFSVGTKQNHFEMQFAIASTVPDAQQPGLAISVSPDRGDGSRMSYLRFEDQSDGIHVFFDDVTDTGPVGTVATFNESDIATIDRTPHTIKLTLDTIDGPGNDVVNVYIDGVLKKTGTSWEDYYRYDPEASAEQSPRIVKTVLFRAGGTAVPGNAGKGFLFDNLSLSSGPIVTPTPTPTATPTPILVGPPTSILQCLRGGWKTFNNPTFKNEVQCALYVLINKVKKVKVDVDIKMSNPKQQMDANLTEGLSSNQGEVEYQNFDYPGGLHYKTKALCVYIDTTTKESRFMFQIPNGHPGLSGLYVVSYVKDGGTPGKIHDLYGHSATSDLTTAQSWCSTGSGFTPNMYSITDGNVVVH